MMHEKHLCCVVTRLFTYSLRVEGGHEVPRLSRQPAHMTMDIGNTRYQIHFSTMTGGFPECLHDATLMEQAKEQARALVTRRYGLPSADVEALFKPATSRARRRETVEHADG